MVGPYQNEVPPPGGYDATPEQRAAAEQRMLEDAVRLSSSHIANELRRLAQTPSDTSVVMDSSDIVK